MAAGIDAKPYAIEAAKGAVAEHLGKHGYEHFKIESTRAFETIFRIRYNIIGTPKISIVIPNKDHGSVSLFSNSIYSPDDCSTPRLLMAE